MKVLKTVLIVATTLAFVGGYAAQKNTERSLKNVFIVDHPLVQHKLTLMRDKETGTRLFGELLQEVALLIGYEATKSIPTHDVKIQTPLTSMVAQKIKENEIVIVPVLRAGMGMADGLRKLLPTARIGLIGLYRNPEDPKKEPIEYLCKLPKVNDQTFIVVDPMLATGNSAVAALNLLKNNGVPIKNVVFMALLAAPEGIARFQKDYPNIPIFVAAVDERLNEHSYIVPGLGDAGDRVYGTK